MIATNIPELSCSYWVPVEGDTKTNQIKKKKKRKKDKNQMHLDCDEKNWERPKGDRINANSVSRWLPPTHLQQMLRAKQAKFNRLWSDLSTFAQQCSDHGGTDIRVFRFTTHGPTTNVWNLSAFCCARINISFCYNNKSESLAIGFGSVK